MLKINDEEVMDRYEIWSVIQKSSDGVEREVAIPEGEADARRFQKTFGGQLWKRYGYSTVGEPIAEEPDEDLLDLV
jgi:hypothetical protein